jgi:hypothetical protein
MPTNKGTGELPHIEHKNSHPETTLHISLLDSPDLDALLNDSSLLIAHATMTEQEIDNLIAQRELAKKRLGNIESWKKERQKKLEQLTNPLDVVDPTDYDTLQKAGLLAQKDAEKLTVIEDRIQAIKKIEHPNSDLEHHLEKLTNHQGEANQRIKEALKQQQSQFTERIEALKNKLTEMYTKRAGELTALLADIESQPRVMDRLKKMKEEQTRKQETEEHEIQTKLLDELTRVTQSMRDRHTRAFARLAEILDNQHIKDEALAALEQSKKSSTIKQSDEYFKNVGYALTRSIIQGENAAQIKSLKEISPRVMPGGIDYSEARRNLESNANLAVISTLAEKGNARAKKLLEQREHILKEAAALDKMLEQKNREGKNVLLTNLAKRRENDENGTTEKIKKAREEQEKTERSAQQEQEKKDLAMAELVKRGGFYVTIPQQIFSEETWHGTGKAEQGAILLERTRGKKGKIDLWRVAEVAGAAKNANLLGTISTLNMGQFPKYVKDAARGYFVEKDGNFIERKPLQNEEET